MRGRWHGKTFVGPVSRLGGEWVRPHAIEVLEDPEPELLELEAGRIVWLRHVSAGFCAMSNGT